MLRPLAQEPYGDVVPAVVEAAQQGCSHIIKLIIDAGAELSFWLSEQTQLPIPTTLSSLAVASPLHSAIWSRNTEVLDWLLRKGFDPNILPLAAITRCITAAMATIVYCDPWNQAAWDCLRQHPRFDPSIRTPIYNVHILHFAVARLSLPLVKAIVKYMPLKTAGKTALGHILLHVVCLPLDERYLNLHSEAIYISIHETRDLSEVDPCFKACRADSQSNN